MNKTCARCEKTVYPIEELKCLDKIWHKGCFKCQECNMTLNMRTYKGYEKVPYCESHVPKVKPTTMAETPELKRIAENTKLQSNAIYHADFEKSKGRFTQVADDPETLRIKANTRIISNVAYHGDLAKKAAMEKQRTINENGELVELPTPDNYEIQIESYASEMLPPSVSPPGVPPTQTSNNYNQSHTPTNHSQPAAHHHTQLNQSYSSNQNVSNQNVNSDHGHSTTNSNREYSRQAQGNANYDRTDNYVTNQYAQNSYASPAQNQSYQPPNVQISSYPNSQQNSVYTDAQSYDRENNTYVHSQGRQGYQQQSYPTQAYQAQGQQAGQQQQKIGRIADYDPISDGPRTQPFTPRQSSTLIYNSSEGRAAQQNNGRGGTSHHQPQQAAGNRRIGSVSDMDPLNDVYGSLANTHISQPQQQQQQQQREYAQQLQQQHLQQQRLQQQQQQQQQQVQQHQHQQQLLLQQQKQQQQLLQQQQQALQQQQQKQQQSKAATAVGGRIYVAMYDYEATDTDEVSFREGDLISNVSSIDEGWMTGQVLRTGHTGMLPANYVDVAPI